MKSEKRLEIAKCECEFDEFEDLSKVSHPSPKAKIHTVVTPMKKSKTCSFFNGGDIGWQGLYACIWFRRRCSQEAGRE